MPKVSIIIPTYNRASLVCRAIDSALAQTYADIEVIVVDDGSTDDTALGVEKYGNRICYLRQPNTGVSAARNRGIRAASGEYIAFLDSDDRILPAKVERQVQFIDAHPEIDIVYSGWQLLDEDGETVLKVCHPRPPGDMRKSLLLEGYLFPPHAALMRRRWVDRGFAFDENLRYFEDPDFWLRLALAGARFASLDHIACQYISSPNSLSKNLDNTVAAITQVLDQVYARQDLPRILLDLQNLAYGRRYLEMGLIYLGLCEGRKDPRMEKAKALLARAFAARPDVYRHCPEFLSTTVHILMKTNPEDPTQAIGRLIEEFFQGVDRPADLSNRLHAEYYIAKAFLSTGEYTRKVTVYYLLKGLRHDPRRIANRGIISLLVRTAVNA